MTSNDPGGFPQNSTTKLIVVFFPTKKNNTLLHKRKNVELQTEKKTCFLGVIKWHSLHASFPNKKIMPPLGSALQIFIRNDELSIRLGSGFWTNGIIFHQPRFPWNFRGFPLLNYHLRWKLVWGRYNLGLRIPVTTRILIFLVRDPNLNLHLVFWRSKSYLLSVGAELLVEIQGAEIPPGDTSLK